jgi:CSLREA domain-containing protein
MTSGVLPPGLTLANGTLSGTVTGSSEQGYNFIVRASNGIDYVSRTLHVNVDVFTMAVTTTMDAVDANLGDHVCATAASACSLRAAVQEANAVTARTKITIGAGTYVLALVGAGEDAAATGDLDVTGELTIIGSSAVLDGNHTDRLLDVRNGGQLTISGLTLQNGNVTGDGGAILLGTTGSLTGNTLTFTGNVASRFGGGVSTTNAAITLTLSTFTGNQAPIGGAVGVSGNATVFLGGGSTYSTNLAIFGGAVGSVGNLTIGNATLSSNNALSSGGAVWSVGTLQANKLIVSGNTAVKYAGGIGSLGVATVDQSSIFGNTAEAGGGVGAAGTLTVTGSTIRNNTAAVAGGGVLNAGATTVTRSTISTNQAPQGGGIFNAGAAYAVTSVLTMVDSTVTLNTGGGVGTDAGASATITNSIVGAQTTGPDCTGANASNGYNLASDASCAFGLASDLNSTAPLLGALADNGAPLFGPVLLTHLLQPGSPAIDTGKPGCGGTQDERGVNRPRGAGCDRGSVEA